MRFLSVAEAAKLKGVSRPAIWYAIKRGALRARRLGRVWMISEEDLAEYVPRGSGRICSVCGESRCYGRCGD